MNDKDEDVIVKVITYACIQKFKVDTNIFGIDIDKLNDYKFLVKIDNVINTYLYETALPNLKEVYEKYLNEIQ